MSLLKKRFHPCGGFFLEGAVKWLLPASVLMLVVGLVMLVIDVILLWDRWMLEKRTNLQDYYIRLGLWSGYVLHMLIALPMDIFLYFASKDKNTLRLRIWSVVNFFNALWTLIVYWAHTFYFGLHIPSLAMYHAYCIYRFYICVVVYYFILELEDEEEMQAAARALTQTELKEFEEGLDWNEFDPNAPLDLATTTLIEKVQYLKYKRDEFEIGMDRLSIDYESPLGNGSFGVVYRAKFVPKDRTDDDDEDDEVIVAVKTVEPGLLNAQGFKALLSELKVMTYLGHHENVLSLIGAVTSDIKSRRLHMVVEFCPFGSLLENLRASRGLYTNLVKNGELHFDDFDASAEGENLSTLDLVKWASEIASGMEFLEIMKVVHGDLAARNVLLSETRQIKIADFGLARQLYQYSVYVKRQNSPLPWRWIALESLTDMNFSSKSDVWSFAILIYEIFTLGEVPYQVQQFTLDFVERLKNGIRLEQPNLCPNEIYKTMIDCWKESPEDRPSFQELRQVYSNFSETWRREAFNVNRKPNP